MRVCIQLFPFSQSEFHVYAFPVDFLVYLWLPFAANSVSMPERREKMQWQSKEIKRDDEEMDGATVNSFDLFYIVFGGPEQCPRNKIIAINFAERTRVINKFIVSCMPNESAAAEKLRQKAN